MTRYDISGWARRCTGVDRSDGHQDLGLMKPDAWLAGFTFIMKTSVIGYVFAIMIAALAALVGVYWYSPAVQLDLLAGAAGLIAVAFLGSVLSYRIQGNTFGEVSFIPYLSAIVLYPSWATVALGSLGTLLAESMRPKPPIKRVFNVSQLTLAGVGALIVYRFFDGPSSMLLDSSFNLRAHTSSVLVFLFINSFAVAAVVALTDNKGIIRTWLDGNVTGLFYDIVAVPAVYAFARAYVDWRFGGIVFLCVLIYGLRVAYGSKYQLEMTNRELLELFASTVEYRDEYTSGHSQRVKRYAVIIAEIIGLPKTQVEKISNAALLHDVGKIHGIFADILTKPGRLTAEERGIMELHPIKGAELVAKISDLQDIVPAIRHHHENWDGTGYPDKLSGREIPLASRIIMFADTIDAMTSDRPYRKALGEIQVREELYKYRGRQFDPEICDVLLSSPEFSRLFDIADHGKVHSLTGIFATVKRRARSSAVA